MSILRPDEEATVVVRRPEAAGDVVLVCEHASRRLPESLGTLGLGEEALSSHIAWDIGALGVAERLSDALDATLVRQAYSRLGYDCNRPPESPAAVPEKSEIYQIPGNCGLDRAALKARADTFYHPFHAALDALIAARLAAGRRVVLVTIHSFTPVYFGQKRDGALGILHDADPSLADRLIEAARKAGLDGVRRNYPYGPEDGVTHTLVRHGLRRGLPHAMLEIRNDLIARQAGQIEWAEKLRVLIRAALGESPAGPGRGEGDKGDGGHG